MFFCLLRPTRFFKRLFVPSFHITEQARHASFLKMAGPRPIRDSSTLSNYTTWMSSHTLVGNVIHQLKSNTNGQSREIILDTSYLDIRDIKVEGGKPLNWEFLPRIEPYGSALKIKLENSVEFGKEIQIDISVKTTQNCTALQWLTPAQTSNKKHPYVFSQCQAIHARSIFPCQDTPDVKSTFDFNITSPLPVIASGLPIRKLDLQSQSSGPQLYRFQQKVPIPCYLFALASGDLAQAPIGPRSVVVTSPDELDACKWELEADTERFIQTIEKIVYPYAWGEYNVLIVPPGFPYGGMENPIFTFATPSIISKDRENVDVIAHEIAHSWSGNLVTNASWDHFWLNEGWTRYLERRILAVLHGEAYRHFSAIIGWKALSDAVARYGEHHEFTKLVINLNGKDPDDAFSTVPYEKGFTFLFHLEKLLGIQNFDKFIVHYFTIFKGKSLDSHEFKSSILDFFSADAQASNLLCHLDWDKWFYSTGLPPEPKFDTSLVERIYELARKWQTLPASSFRPAETDLKGLLSNQLVVFLEQVLSFEKSLTPDLWSLMGRVYGFLNSTNAEVLNVYLQVGLKAGNESVIAPTVDLLGKIGRMKFVRPLYRALQRVDSQVAFETFEKYKEFYHPICRAMVEKDLFGKERL
ncbi:Peptidase family M1 domain containing protein [Elaphomyces granulatus]